MSILGGCLTDHFVKPHTTCGAPPPQTSLSCRCLLVLAETAYAPAALHCHAPCNLHLACRFATDGDGMLLLGSLRELYDLLLWVSACNFCTA